MEMAPHDEPQSPAGHPAEAGTAGCRVGLELFRRRAENPILTARDWPYPANTVFNAGACQVRDETVLLVRVEDRRGHSHLTVARSKDGVSNWRIDSQASFAPDPANHAEEEWGVEDPRVTWVEDRGHWVIAYTAYSPNGPLVSLAETKDFASFQRIGAVMPPENKDAAVFPCRFANRYAMIHRPVASGQAGANIWISFSPDMVHWGEHQVLLRDGAAHGGTPAKSAWVRHPWKRPRAGWFFTTACRDGRRLFVPPGTGAARPGRSLPGRSPQRRMGLCARVELRASGRRQRRGISLRLGSRQAQRRDPPLLWRGRHLPGLGDGPAFRPPRLPSQVPRAENAIAGTKFDLSTRRSQPSRTF